MNLRYFHYIFSSKKGEYGCRIVGAGSVFKGQITFTKFLLKILSGILYFQGTNDPTGFYKSILEFYPRRGLI